MEPTQNFERHSARRNRGSAKHRGRLARRIKHIHRRKKKMSISREVIKSEKEMSCPLCKRILSDENALIDHLGQGLCPNDTHAGRVNTSDQQRSHQSVRTVSNKEKKESTTVRPSHTYNQFSHKKEPDQGDDIIVSYRKPVWIDIFLT